MIKKIKDSNTLLEVTDKLEYVKDCKLDKQGLYSMMMGTSTFTYAGFDEDNKMNSCAVYFVTQDVNGEKVLYVVFQWIDPHFLKLWKKWMFFAEEVAKKLGATRISFTTARNEKAIKRQIGKYGYYKTYNVIEKRM